MGFCIPAWADLAPLIERTKLLGNPTRTRAALSPDGKWLGWIAPRDGVLNIWISETEHPDEGRPLTDSVKMPVTRFHWAPDSHSVLYVQDSDGDENYALYAASVNGSGQKALTPPANVHLEIQAVSPLQRDRILVLMNNRDPHLLDLLSLDLASGKLTPVLINNSNFAYVVTDDALVPRLIARSRPDGGYDIAPVQDGKISDKGVITVPPDDWRTTSPAGFSRDGKSLYWYDSRGRNTSALAAQDIASGKFTLLAQEPRADIDDVLTDPKTGQPQAYAARYLDKKWVVLDPAIKTDFEVLAARLGGNFSVSSRTDADDLWTIVADTPQAPPTSYLYRRSDHRLTALFAARPDLAGAILAVTHGIEIKTRDGLTETGYLTLPAQADGKDVSRPPQPLPLLLLVHGGPWLRDMPGYNAQHQFWSNRGYAVLSVNFRGSTGFGKSFIAASKGQWGARMQNDLEDAANWAVRNKIARPDRIAIMGHGYGGYAALVGLAFTPDRYACGIDIDGPVNLNTLLARIPPYWEPIRPLINGLVGDPTTKAGKTLLHDRSPLFRARAINRPLLIAQGANDPRVNRSEADQIVTFLNGRSIPATYVLFPDEGDRFQKPQNQMAFAAIAEHFLQRCLGGRSEPFHEVMRESAAQLMQGIEDIPGLKEALAVR